MSEATEHQAVTQYLRLVYPKAIFNSDMSGVKLTKFQAAKAKELRSSRAFPDLIIYEPRGEYYGLFLELKKTGFKTHRKDGSLRLDEHLQEQAEMIAALKNRGYYATFACGFDQARKIIDWYFNQMT